MQDDKENVFINTNHVYGYSFTVCASKWQVEFFKPKPNEVNTHGIDYTCGDLVLSN